MNHQPPTAQPWFCPRCGYSNISASSFCTQCGTSNPFRLASQTGNSPYRQQPQAPPSPQPHPQPYHPYPPPQYVVQPVIVQGVPVQPMMMVMPPKSRIAFILLGLFLGGFGVHNFYAGYTGRGVAQLLITLFTFWLILPLLAVGLWVIIEIIVVNRDARGVPFS